MFTGLIQQVGRLARIEFSGEAGRLWLNASFPDPLQPGESIAVNGACLTLVEQRGQLLAFDILRETFARTALADKAPGAPLNLERALRLGDPLGGHLVSGHVDGTGDLVAISSAGRDTVLDIACKPLIADMVPKGSIAIDGVSLTVAGLGDDSIAVEIIPHTWAETSLNERRPGDPVNLEAELIGKHVARLLEGSAATQPQKQPISEELLRQSGFME